MRRNPYFIVGVDYGATTAEATKAFGRAAKRLRNHDEGNALDYTIEDLTWALHQIDHMNAEPDSSVDHFRVPADPSAYRVQVTDGVLLLPVRPLDRSTDPIGASELEQIREQALDAGANWVLARQEQPLRFFDRDIDTTTPIDLGRRPPPMGEIMAVVRQRFPAPPGSPGARNDKDQQGSSLNEPSTGRRKSWFRRSK
ncbi:MAG TPA: hypothetical protein DHW34_05225 [Actinobacteria bacterium]|nr:hypothetical protein [Actinomycetota bacterium]